MEKNQLPQCPLVSAEWLLENINQPNLVVLDASVAKPGGVLPIENSGIQIKGARFFDINGAFSDSASDLPHTFPTPERFQEEARKIGISANSVIVAYDVFGIYSSPRAWWMFLAMGHKNIFILDGGLPAWLQSQGPCENKTEALVPSSGNFKATYVSGKISDEWEVFANIDNASIKTLDARSSGRFYGTAPEPRAGLRSGHIPGSLSLPFDQILDGIFMKKDSELKRIYENLLQGEKPRLVFSCGSGLTACIIALGASLSGYKNLSVYDGSWSEWGREGSGWPVELNEI